MSPITSIEQLVECFDDAEPSEQARILKRLDIPSSNFEKYTSWIDDGYSRNCIVRKKGFEFILLCWDRDAETSIHDHSGQHCWVYQVEGTVKEKRFKISSNNEVELQHELLITKGDLTYMHDRMGFHSIKNVSNKRAITLHIYASPIDACRIFNPNKKHLEKVDLEYHSIDGKAVPESVN